MFEFSRSSAVTITFHAYPNFLNKGNDPLRMKMPNCSSYLSIFVDAGENLVKVDDLAMPSNPLVTLVEENELEETLLNVNVSQRLCEEEPSKRMVRIRVNRSTWDRQLSPNPHALAIYLEFVFARGAAPERFEECQCEDDDVHIHYQTWVPGDGHYRWL